MPEEIKQLTIEGNKKVKVVNPKTHSTFSNPKPKPSSVVGKPNHKPQQFHFHDIYPSSDNPPHDVDKSCHLSDSASTTDSLDESSSLNAPYDHLLQLDSTTPHVNYKTHLALKLNFVPEFEGQLENLSQTDVSLEHYDYELFLLNQEIDTPSDNLSHQESHNCEKLCQDDPSLLLSQTLL